MASAHQLLTAFDALLEPERFKDYGPNGLQVEGRVQVQRIVSGVTASLALIDAAIEARADAVFVHHGLFWRGQDGRVVGWMKQRLARLLAHDINLYASERFGEQGLGFLGAARAGDAFADAGALAAHVERALGRSVVCVSGSAGPITRVAWCTGGAQGYFEAAIASGAQAFITGEISEPQAHYARECGVSFLACGHHASERYGAPAVAAHVASQLGLEHVFIDIPNPA